MKNKYIIYTTSVDIINMQMLLVANAGYLCPSLQLAEYELKREKREDRGSVRG